MSVRTRRRNPRQPEKKKFPWWGWALIITGILIVIIIIVVVIILITRRSSSTPSNPSGCTSDAGCSGLTPKCNTSTGVCQQCLITANCPGGQNCVGGNCIAVQCQNDTDCTSGTFCNMTTNQCECPFPDTVSDLLIFSGFTPGTILGTFTAEPNVIYDIEVWTGPGGTGDSIVVDTTSTGGFALNVGGGTVYARVRGTNQCGNMALNWSNDATDCVAHPPPSDFTVNVSGITGSYNFNITIGNDGGANQFFVEFWTGPSGTGSLEFAQLFNTNPLIFNAPIPFGDYFIRIKGTGPCAQSEYSFDINQTLMIVM